MSLAWGEPETAVPCLLFTIVYMTTGWSGMHIPGTARETERGTQSWVFIRFIRLASMGRRVATHTMC